MGGYLRFADAEEGAAIDTLGLLVVADCFHTRAITHGYLEGDGQIWDADGNLVALSRQLALAPR